MQHRLVQVRGSKFNFDDFNCIKTIWKELKEIKNASMRNNRCRKRGISLSFRVCVHVHHMLNDCCVILFAAIPGIKLPVPVRHW